MSVGVTIRKAAYDVAPLYRYNDWRWMLRSGSSGVPSESDIEEQLWALYIKVRDDPKRENMSLTTGMLCVRRLQGDDGPSYIFSLELGETD